MAVFAVGLGPSLCGLLSSRICFPESLECKRGLFQDFA